MERKLGLELSPKDIRDFLLANYLPPLTVSVPDEFLEWLKWQSPVEYQAGLGACVSFSSTGQAEGYNYKEYGKAINLSAQFAYDEAKKRDGMPNVEGTHFRALYKGLLDIGCCEEQYLPYEGRYPPTGSPMPGYLDNAAQYKISAYASVNVTKEAIKQAIYQNGPVTIAIKVYDNFAELAPSSDGIAQFPSGKYQGGHGIVVPAYNKLGLICKNSWSEYWGGVTVNGTKYKGYCIIPWAVFESITLGEVWSIVDVIARKKPWTDLELEPELAWLVKNSGVFKGYSDTEFRPWNNVTQHQTIVVAERLGLPLPKLTKEQYEASWITFAQRGWIHNLWPQYNFLEERWEESLTRFQFMVLIGRYIKSKISSRGTVI